MELHTSKRKAIIVRPSTTFLWLRRFIIFACVIACGLYSPLIRAQEPDFTWMASFGGVLITNSSGAGYPGAHKVSSLALDPNGNILLTGLCDFATPTYVGPNGTNYLPRESFVAEVNPAGKLLWTRCTGTNTDLLGAAADTNGNVYVSGFTNTAPYTVSHPGKSNVLLTKYDPHGYVSWSLQSSGLGMDGGVRVTLDNSNNLYLTGFFTSSYFVLGSIIISNVTSDFLPLPHHEEFIAKIDPEGKVLWVKPIYGATSYSPLNQAKIDSSGNIILGGTFDRPMRLGDLTLNNKGSNDIFVAKYDPAGKLLDTKDIGNAEFWQIVHITADKAGNIYVGGIFEGSSATFGKIDLPNHGMGGLQNFLVKFTSDGKVAWAAQPLVSPGVWMDTGALFVDASGNVYQCASFMGSEVHFGKTALSIGDSRSNRNNHEASTFYLAKYDSAGTLAWVADVHTKEGHYRELQGNYNFIEADKQGNLYFAGMERNFSISGQRLGLPNMQPGIHITVELISKEQCFLAKLPADQTAPEGVRHLSW